jgi:hypothetical protein
MIDDGGVPSVVAFGAQAGSGSGWLRLRLRLAQAGSGWLRLRLRLRLALGEVGSVGHQLLGAPIA